MLVAASSLINLPIITLSGQKIGQVLDFVCDEESGKLLALVASRSVFKGPKVISILDILDVKGGYVIVESEEAVVDPSEIVRVASSLQKGIRILGARVVTEARHSLGYVFDFVFDVPGFFLQRLYVRKNLLGGWREMAITADKIVKILPRRIVVSEDLVNKVGVVEPA